MPRSKGSHTAQVPYAVALKLKRGSEALLRAGVKDKTWRHWVEQKSVPAAHVIRELLALTDGAQVVQHSWATLGIPEMDTIEPRDQPVILSVWRALARLKASNPAQFTALQGLIERMAADLPPVGGVSAQAVRPSSARRRPSGS